ncbi:hypothetical protein [Homoserinimonas hongtaonis]|nr:hypothetical protein [Salinibacterium hongtaonis]
MPQLALSVLVVAVGFYVLYGVIRAAVRDGIRAARADRQTPDRITPDGQ